MIFHEVQFRRGETPLCDPKTAQDEAKIGPRSPQDGLKTDLKHDRFLRRFFDRFLVFLGSVLAPFSRPRWVQKPIQERHRILGPRPFGANRRQPPPRPPQDGSRPPKSAPRGPKRAKRNPKTTKRIPNDPQDDRKQRLDYRRLR